MPGPAITGSDLAQRLGLVGVDLDEETGIAARYFADPGNGPSGLAAQAAVPALAQAGVSVEDLGMLIFATTTPDVAFPGSACFLQHRLDAPTVGALDIRAQAAGFLGLASLVMAMRR